MATPVIGHYGYHGSEPKHLQESRVEYSCWIAPSGKMYAVEYHMHGTFAHYVLGDINFGGDLERTYVHISAGNIDAPRNARITQAQIDTLFDIRAAMEGNDDWMAINLSRNIDLAMQRWTQEN